MPPNLFLTAEILHSAVIYPPAMYISRTSLKMLADCMGFPHESTTGYILTLVYCLLEAENLTMPFVEQLLSLASKFNFELLNTWRHPKLKIGFLHYFAVKSEKLFQGHPGFHRASRQERLVMLLKRLIKSPSGRVNSVGVDMKAPLHQFACAEFLNVDCMGSIGTPYTLAKLYATQE